MIRTLLCALLFTFLSAAPVIAADATPTKIDAGRVGNFQTGDTVGLTHGGTGATTLTAHCVVVGAGTSAVHTVCPATAGNVLTDNGASADPSFQPAASGGTPGGSSGQVQYNNAGAFGGFTASGDATINTSTGAVSVTKTGGVAFAASATTDTTDAGNISTGTLGCSRLPSLTGDVTTSGCAATLATSGVTAGSYTAANITVDAKGRVTAASNGAGGGGTVTTTGTPASGNLTKFSGSTSITNGDLSGDITTSGSLTTSYAGVVPASKGGAGSVSGILKANGSGTVSAAASGTDYAPATSGSAILKGNGSGGFSSAVSGTDYAPATSGSSILYGNGSGGFSNATVGTGLSFSGGTLSATGGSGTVTTTGSPASGNLAAFSGSTSITNSNLSGDCTTSGTLAVTCTKTSGTNFGTFATQNYATPPAIGGTTPAAGAFTTLSATGNLTTNVTGSTQCLQANSSGVVSGTGTACAASGGGWTLVTYWTQAGSGSATFVTGTVTGYNDVLIIGNQLTNTNSVQYGVQVSTDGGSTWYTASGNYNEVAATGVESGNVAFFPMTTPTTSARDIAVEMFTVSSTKSPKVAWLFPRAVMAQFAGSTSAITTVRVLGLASNVLTGTINGGSIQIWAR